VAALAPLAGPAVIVGLLREPKMKRVILAATLAVSTVGLVTAADTPNTLTNMERAEGWKLLFDGTTTQGWRGYLEQTVPDGWKVVDGALALSGEEGSDIITLNEYENFDFKFEWKISPKGNSGVFYLIAESPDLARTYYSGPEYQVLDNDGHPDAKDGPDRFAGANYALYPPTKNVARPVGEWNQGRIVKQSAHVEHWLNGEKVVEYELWSDDWKTRVEKSKFGKMPAYAKAKKGHLGLQNHGNDVWFRSLKVRVLPESKGTTN
jgi:hypothetical protein